jgi:hypothetical protein
MVSFFIRTWSGVDVLSVIATAKVVQTFGKSQHKFMKIILAMVVQHTTMQIVNMKKTQRKTSPMQVRLDRPFKAEIKAAADQLKISSCDLVRLSVATQLRKIRTGQIEIADLVGA